MPATILSGVKPASAILETLRPRVKQLDPKLVIVQVGHDPASESYIRKKLQSCTDIGMRNAHMQFPDDVPFETLADSIRALNEDEDVTGYIIQLPLPPHLKEKEPLLFRAIDPMKDVDGFTAYNVGKLFLSRAFEHLPPATPAGIIALLEHYRIPVAGKHAVIVGASNIVGKPLALMLLHREATVTICHSATRDLPHFTLQADILWSAVGEPGLIQGNMVKQNAVVIDIGITQTPDGIRGDADFDSVSHIASSITPVPGGAGPMTVAALLQNVVTAKERQMQVNA
jgi:methylenetetrahydrofolate dehydrogenase (NADP+)/methenyltetrahydrofolate cyclohydrolase